MTIIEKLTVETKKYLHNPLTDSEKALLADYNRMLCAELEGEEMVEKVARALYDTAAGGNPRVIRFEHAMEERLRCLWQAKAALAVVRGRVG